MHGVGHCTEDSASDPCFGDLTAAEMALIDLVRSEKGKNFSVTIRCQLGRYTVVQNPGPPRGPVLGAGDTFDEAWDAAGCI